MRRTGGHAWIVRSQEKEIGSCGQVLHVLNVSMQKIQILFPDPVMMRLRRLAKIQDRPVSEIVRRAVEDALARMPETPSASERRRIPSFHGGKILAPARSIREVLYKPPLVERRSR